MVARSQQLPRTPQEYLSQERLAEHRSELWDGVIVAMAGSSVEHSRITANIIVALGAQLRGKPCRVFTSDLKVRTDSLGLFAYPDVSIVCGTPGYHDEMHDVVTNPSVLFEVLSPSTETIDRGPKFLRYQTIASLRDYFLVAQDEARVERYERQGDGGWRYTAAYGTCRGFEIASIDCTLSLADVYDGVTFPDR